MEERVFGLVFKRPEFSEAHQYQSNYDEQKTEEE
jgi:hypothetical protein